MRQVIKDIYRAIDDAGGGDDFIDLEGSDDTEGPGEDPGDEQPEEETPEPAFDPTSISDDVIAAEYQRRAALYTPAAPAPVATAPAEPDVDPRIAQLQELSYSEPEKAEALRLEIATDAALKKVRAEFEGRFAQMQGQMAPVTTERAIAQATADPVEQEFLRSQAIEFQKQGVDITQLMGNPLTRDLLTRASKQYAIEKTPAKVPTHFGSSSEAVNMTAEDQRLMKQFAAATGQTLTKEDYAMALADSRKNPLGGMN